MSIINIQRDGRYVSLDRTLGLGWSTPYTHFDSNATANTNGAVHDDYGIAYASPTNALTMAANEMSTVGVYMLPPKKDRVPYRVIASLVIPLDGDGFGAITMGWAPVNLGTTDAIIEETHQFAFQRNYSGMFIVNQPKASMEGRALFIGVSVIATKVISAGSLQAHLSVQNLGVKPPTMHNAIS